MGKWVKWLTLKVIVALVSIRRQIFANYTCRFHPCCSEYTKEAFKIHKPARAIKLVVLRILKCHPFHSCGYDPVPK